MPCGVFSDQGWNPCSLHWQVNSQPLDPQGSPRPPLSWHVKIIWNSKLGVHNQTQDTAVSIPLRVVYACSGISMPGEGLWQSHTQPAKPRVFTLRPFMESLPVPGPDDSGGPSWLSHSRQGTAFTFEVFPPPHRHQLSLWILHLALPCPDWMGSAKGSVIQGVGCWKPRALKKGTLVGARESGRVVT